MSLRRWTLLVAALVYWSGISFSQTNDWAIVRQLTPGQKVQVETTAGKQFVGKVQSVDEDGFRIGKNRTIQKQDVQRVRLWSSGHHARNALIGLGVGAGAGVVLGVASCGGKDAFFSRGECAAISAPFLGGLGAAVGVLIPSHGKWQEVYQAK